MCDPRRAVPPTLPAEKARVGKASAALPRDGREPRRREGRPPAWSQTPVRLRRRCRGEDAQLIAARAAPPSTAWPDCLLPDVAWLAE